MHTLSMSTAAKNHDAAYANFAARMLLATELLAAMTECRTAAVVKLAAVQAAETVIPVQA